MLGFHKARAKLKGQFRAFAILFLATLFLATGCKTSDDAVAAATQMSATAKALSDYYTALNTILSNTDQLYILNQQLTSRPYTAENRQLMKNNQAELAKRAALAADFSTLAAEFAKLSGSTAAADVSASAVKLQTEVDSLASVKASTGEQNMLKSALEIFVKAIQEHKEREAARAICDIAKGLTALFIKEGEVWNSVETNYTRIAANLAVYLVDHDATDNSGLLKVALDPFGLTPSSSTSDLKALLTPLAKQQIATRTAALDDSYVKATDAMTKSLQEMTKRISAVAEDKPMAFRMPPLTVDLVEKWVAQVESYF
jgi:phage host-nuclease inhibitor protein Gam